MLCLPESNMVRKYLFYWDVEASKAANRESYLNDQITATRQTMLETADADSDRAAAHRSGSRDDDARRSADRQSTAASSSDRKSKWTDIPYDDETNKEEPEREETMSPEEDAYYRNLERSRLPPSAGTKGKGRARGKKERRAGATPYSGRGRSSYTGDEPL